MKKVLLVVIMSLFLVACGESIEREAYFIHQDLIAKEFPTPKSLKFPVFNKDNVVCGEEWCTIVGTLEYKNQFGVRVTADYDVLLQYDDEYFYLEEFNLYER